MPQASKTRVVILGAGPAGLAAAWALTAPEQGERYAVTLYQLGWQAGGLCSTGRIAPQMWVNQNGTHYLFGAYRNSFEICRQAYAELAAAGDHRFGRFEDQFVRRDRVVFQQFFQGRWTQWPVEFPTNALRPGDDEGEPGPAATAAMALQWLLGLVTGAQGLGRLHALGVFPGLGTDPPRWWAPLRALAWPAARALEHATLTLDARGFTGASAAIRPTLAATRALRSIVGAALAERLDTSLEALRLWILIDLATTLAIGLLEHLRDGTELSTLDDVELREWLRRCGASPAAIDSPVVMAAYNAIAAYEDGDVARPNISAAVGLACIFHLMFRYAGSVAYQITWGIGDAFIAPLCAALRLRGVRFAYFHRVWALVGDAGGEQVERIEVERQVELDSGDPYAYAPFTAVEGRPVWPDAPRWEQVAGGAVDGPRLDSFYAPRRGATVELRAGRDFDVVIGAMGSAVYRYCAPSLVAQKPHWRAIVDELRTVETQSLRLWFRDDLAALGWTHGPPITTSFVQPFATWEDPTPLLATERWACPPKTLAHLFGPLPHPRIYPGPEHGSAYERAQQRQAERAAEAWLGSATGHLWPAVADLRLGAALDPSALVHRQIRANPGPLQAYTMIVAGTLRHRPRAEDSGYDNLLLAGDWTRTGFDVGSFEGAVLSGYWAARALSGHPAQIHGTILARGDGPLADAAERPDQHTDQQADGGQL